MKEPRCCPERCVSVCDLYIYICDQSRTLQFFIIIFLLSFINHIAILILANMIIPLKSVSLCAFLFVIQAHNRGRFMIASKTR